jgi:hypothetical protein
MCVEGVLDRREMKGCSHTVFASEHVGGKKRKRKGEGRTAFLLNAKPTNRATRANIRSDLSSPFAYVTSG